MNQDEWRGWGEVVTLYPIQESAPEPTRRLEDDSDTKWARWFSDTESRVGHVLDEDQIEHAYECYGIGMTPQAYANHVRWTKDENQK